MTIVCGTDFSKEAADAVEVAALLASAGRDRLRLVHVLDELGELEPRGEERSVYDAQRLLLEKVSKSTRRRGADTEVELTSGEVAPALVRAASGAGASLVVVSWLGRRSPSRWLGSHVAERLVCRSAVDTLIVRDPAPFRAWLSGERPLRVTLAMDLSHPSKAMVEWIADLRRWGPCDVTVVYVAWPPAEHKRLGIAGPMDLEDLQPEVERTLRRELSEKLGSLSADAQVELAVCQSFGRVDHRLVHFAEEQRADLIVIGGRKRSWTERLWQRSVAKGILHLAHTNVASVATEEGPRPAEWTIPAIHQVLVATDLSESGHRAIEHGCSLLSDGGTLHLVHVVSPPRVLPVQALLGSKSESEADRRVRDAMDERLRQIVPAWAARLNISAMTHVVAGDVAEEICGLANRLGVDVVCVGTHGRTGVAAALLGSVARAVIATSTRPVLVVPPLSR